MTSPAAAEDPAAQAFRTAMNASVPPQTRVEASAGQVSGDADTRDMLVVHGAFRREFRLAPGLVRRTHAGDVDRAKLVADHIALITTFLHLHHNGEDRHLWPMVLRNVDEAAAPVVLLMEAHHEAMSAQMDAIEELRGRFEATAGEAEREELAGACDRLVTLLNEHLDAEEARILPLAAQHISAQEWATLGEEGMGDIPKKQLPLAFGMMTHEGDPEVVAEMIAKAPLLVRLIVPPLARRAFKRYALRVHGTATP